MAQQRRFKDFESKFKEVGRQVSFRRFMKNLRFSSWGWRIPTWSQQMFQGELFHLIKHSLWWLLSDPSPGSDHWQCLSVTDSLTHCCLVNLTDVTPLSCEDANSKLVHVVTVADEDCVGNNLLQISKLRFGQKAKFLFRLWAQGLVKIFQLKFRQDLKLCLASFFLLMFCRGWS